MNGTNGNEPRCSGKCPCSLSCHCGSVEEGNPDAMKIVLQHFSGCMSRLSMRKLYDGAGTSILA